ncbi:MAG: AAA family ATPase, partial [Gemmatimonadetes bacterium]|nr:AAA family ATPase [Gemmatimonadota bacterium]
MPELQWRKHVALLIHLALSPNRARTRDHLLGLLWPEKDESKARRSLNEAVRRLRRCLGDERLLSRGDAIELAEAGLEVDALRFLEAVERDPARAATLIQGDFLEGFTLDDAPAFEEWAASERDRFRSRATGVLVALGERELASSRFAQAGDAGRRALSIQSYAEPAVRLVMRAAALAGDGAGALAAYRDFAARLAGIGEKPSRELAALSERVRQQAWRPAAAARQEPEPPLIGRNEVYREAFNLLATALELGARTLVVTGEPGMGRSRLLTECADRLALEGAIVVAARPLATDYDAQWSTLRQLMRGGLAAAPGLVGAPPEALGVLAGVAPELAQRFAPREPQDASEVAAALAQIFSSIAEERPLALLVDDAHLADGATLTALGAALEQVRALRVVLVLSASDQAGSGPAELLRLRGAVGRSLPGVALKLEPLTPDDLRSLLCVLTTWCRDDEQRDRLNRRLASETGGNPFFAVTLLRGLERMATLRDDFIAWPPPQRTDDSPIPFTLPELFRTAVAVRIKELDEAGRQVLSAASVTGQAIDLGL